MNITSLETLNLRVSAHQLRKTGKPLKCSPERLARELFLLIQADIRLTQVQQVPDSPRCRVINREDPGTLDGLTFWMIDNNATAAEVYDLDEDIVVFLPERAEWEDKEQ